MLVFFLFYWIIFFLKFDSFQLFDFFHSDFDVRSRALFFSAFLYSYATPTATLILDPTFEYSFITVSYYLCSPLSLWPAIISSPLPTLPPLSSLLHPPYSLLPTPSPFTKPSLMQRHYSLARHHPSLVQTSTPLTQSMPSSTIHSASPRSHAQSISSTSPNILSCTTPTPVLLCPAIPVAYHPYSRPPQPPHYTSVQW